MQGEIKRKQAEDAKEQERAVREKAKAKIDAEKQLLQASEEKLHSLEHGDHFSVDSLRKIGGGATHTNYQGIASREELQKQAMNLPSSK